MRFWNILFFLFIVSFSGSCGLFSSESEKKDEDDENVDKFRGDISLECSQSERCKGYCNDLFAANPSLLSKCLDQESDDVTNLNAVISSMEKSSWDSIKKEPLYILVNFDDSIWPKYASVNSTVSAQEMLLWVAKEEEVADLLDEKNEVLRKAFTILGAPAHKDSVVFEGMKQDVDLDNRQSFFEVSALNKNDKAFRAAHDLLKEECNSKACIKRLYCDIDATFVFGKLNELELGGDADADGDSLHRDECN